MVIPSGYSTTPHHRQNRRREQPGSRTRRTITRKSLIQDDCHEGVLDAYDSNVLLPSDKAKPSPLLRENFDQSWRRWKAKQAEERALAEMDKMQLEQEQIKLFGGDVNDDELYRMGILYNDEDNMQDESNSVVRDVPSTYSVVPFVIRQGKPRRSRRSNWRALPLYLSLSDLSDDAEIARLLSPPNLHKTTIQHRHDIFPTPMSTDILPLSFPSSPALGSSGLHFLDTSNSSALHLDSGDWTFIDIAHHNSQVSTPSSEPETWILLSDDS